MRINKYIALASGVSRRKADELIALGKVLLNDEIAETGSIVQEGDTVLLNNQQLTLPVITTILFNKPVGYVCSREGQGNKTIYELLPTSLHHLKSVGRLDKDSSGLLLLTNDGKLADELTHPRYEKEKTYRVILNKPLTDQHRDQIRTGITLEDGLSRLGLDGAGKEWTVTMHEGRNRQIRRTFSALGYKVIALDRLSFGSWKLNDIARGNFVTLD